jgi:crossover junction endodeoxyribonuclease RusA
MKLSLPFPPSVNSYWRHPTKGKLAGRHLISEAGRAYRVAVLASVLEQRARRTSGRLAVRIFAYPPDRRRRDLDNLLKASLDALTHAGMWEDDSNIDAIDIQRRDVVPGGRLDVEILAIGGSI